MTGTPNNRKIKDKIIQRVERTLLDYKMISPGQAVLVGVSGGPDSVALIHILKALSLKFSLRLGIAHLNHSLRAKESDLEAQFVVLLAKKLNLPCFAEKKNVREYQRKNRLCLEEAARHVRYAFFNDLAKSENCNSIALGHHRDDNAELVLMYLLRGAGLSGISGIPRVRNRIIRPLSDLSRTQILDYLNAENIRYVTDLSNRDTRFLRNRIRHELLPFLRDSYNPKISENLNRLSLIVSDEENWIKTVVEPIFQKALIFAKPDLISLSINEICEIHPGLCRRIIRKGISLVKKNLRRITFSHIEAILRLLKNGPEHGILHLPGRIRIQRYNNTLTFSKEKKQLRSIGNSLKSDNPDFSYTIIKPQTIFIREVHAYFTISQIEYQDLPDLRNTGPDVAFFDMDRLSFPLVLRKFQPGDRFKPLGMTGTQKVKSYFINNKVSRSQRTRRPILVCNEKIVWIVGMRIAEPFKLRSSSVNIIKCRFFPVRDQEPMPRN